jgi:RHS repeat-associated protein
MTDPQSGVTTYSYDTLNRLTNIHDPSSHDFGFSYDALSRRTQLTRPNGVNTNYSYDALSRLLSILHQVGSTTLDGASYSYDSAGNRTSKTDMRTSTTSNYSYDDIYQLTGVTQGTSTTESYTYDAVGNRLSSLGVSPYSYNASNELTSTPSATYTYDYNGSMLTKADSTGTTSYSWDYYTSKLDSVTLPGSGGTVSFKYDPFGRRTQKSFTQGSTTTTTNYLYDVNNVLEEVDNSGAVLARYTQGEIDEPLSELQSAANSYYEQDGIGSITSITSSTGALGNTYGYNSFGTLISSSGAITNPFEYTAREFDNEIGISYYRARYYDPATGRFISEDPSRAEGNYYAYVENDPISLNDPFGLQSCTYPEILYKPCAPPAYGSPIDTTPPSPPTPGVPVWWPNLGPSGSTSSGSGPAPTPNPIPAPTPGPDYAPERKPGGCKQQNGCKPCVPPVGTISYRSTARAHFPFTGPHWSLYEMHQAPAPSCRCFWEKLGVGQGPMAPYPKIDTPGGGGPL